MRVCDDMTMQDALPVYARGALGAMETDAVRAHLALCESCAAEVRLLVLGGAVIDRATPALDLARIAAAATAAATTAAAAPRTIELRTRTWWASRQMLAAAASILVVVSLSIPALRGTPDGVLPEVRLDSVGALGGSTVSPATVAAASIDLAGGLADLSSAQLETLLNELDQVEATVRAEPATIALPLIDSPELL